MRRDKQREQALRESVGRAWLAWIERHGSPPIQQQLADELGISRHAVGRSLRYLEIRGVPITSDSRRASVTLGALPVDHPAAERWREEEKKRRERTIENDVASG